MEPFKRGEPWIALDNPSRSRSHREIAAFADRQHGPIRRDQLVALGMREPRIDYRVNNEQFFVVHPGVYAMGNRTLSDLGSWSAAVLAADQDEDAYLSWQTAGLARGFLTHYEGPIHVTVTRKNRPDLDGVVAHSARLLPWEIGSHKGIPCTSKARTLFDLAKALPTKPFIRAFQRALQRGVTIKQLDGLLADHKGERGTRILRQLVDIYRHDRGLSKGGFEDAVWLWLLKILPHDFPRPKRNERVTLSDGIWIEADLLSGRKIIELDFFDHHGGNRYQTTLDHQRDRAVRADGWELERFTSDEFQLDRARMERDVRRFLGF